MAHAGGPGGGRRGPFPGVHHLNSRISSLLVAGGRAKAAGRLLEEDPLEDERLEAEEALREALHEFWAPQFDALRRQVRARRLELLAAQQFRAEQSRIKASNVEEWLASWEPGTPPEEILAATPANMTGAELEELVDLLYGGDPPPFDPAVDSVDIALDWGLEEARMVAELEPLLQAIFAQAGTSLKKRYPQLLHERSWEVVDQKAAAHAQAYTYDLIHDLTESSRKQLGQAIARWIAAEEGLPELVERIRRIVPPNPYPVLRDRAQLVAQTETTRVYADSRALAFQEAGLKQWRWRTAMDELVCPICAPLGLANNGEGAVGAIAGGFVHEGSGQVYKRPPAHPGCRCWVVEDAQELEALMATQAPITPKPPKAQKPAKKPKPKDEPPPPPPPKPKIPWQPSMLPEEAEAWVLDQGNVVSMFNATFYAKTPSHQWKKVAAGGLPPKEAGWGFGQGIELFPQYAKPEGVTLSVPAKVQLKNPFLIFPDQDPAETAETILAKYAGDGDALARLAQHGHDGVVLADKSGNIIHVMVPDPSQVVLVKNQYGKPATSKWKPPKKKPPKPAPPPETYDLEQWELPEEDLLAKDLYSDGIWGSSGKAAASYGGILFDEQGRVLLRRPKGEFGGYAWTWPKGQADKEEHPLTAAQREVAEETGHKARALGWLQKGYKGDTGLNRFFVMRSTGHDPGLMDQETEEVRWATREEAQELIGQSKNKAGRQRDLEILEDAFIEFDSLKDPLYRQAVKTDLASAKDAAVVARQPPRAKAPAAFPHDLASLENKGHAKGATHEAYLYQAPDGSRWLHKPQDAFLAHIDRTAYEVAYALGHDAAETYVVQHQGRAGSMQRWYPNVRSPLSGVRPTQAQVVQAQKEAIFDWLIGNNDGHANNLLVLEDGRVVGVDKGQSFKFWEQDRLDWDFNPNQGFGVYSWHNVQMSRYAQGEDVWLADLDHPELDQFLRRIESLDDEAYKALLRPYAEAAVKARGPRHRRTALPFDDVDRFLESAVQRKNSIRRDWQAYYSRARQARHRALGIVEERPAPAGALTPITEDLVREIQASGWQGKSILFGGADVEDMAGLVYEVEGDGTILEFKVRKDAESRIWQRLGIPPPSGSHAAASSADPYYPEVVKLAKSYNYHLKEGGDQVIPPHTVDGIQALVKKLDAARKTGDEAAAHHYDYIKALADELEGKQPAKHMLGVFADAFKPKPKKEERPEATRPRSLDVQKMQQATLPLRIKEGRLVHDPKAVERRRGQQVRVQLANGVTAYYTPHGNGNRDVASSNGSMFIQMDGEADPGRIQHTLDSLAELGLENRLATRDDIEWTYLVKTSYAAGVDHTSLVDPQDDIPTQIRKLQAYWSKQLKVKDVTRLPHYDPHPVYDSPTPATRRRSGVPAGQGQFGIPRWRRFDIDPEAFDREMEGYHLVHSLTQSHAGVAAFLEQALTNNGSLVATEEKFRLGIPIGGMSPGADQGTGGAAYVFTRIARGPGRYQQLVFDRRLLLDTDAISYGHDAYGRVDPDYIRKNRLRTISQWKGAVRNSSNETIIKRNISLVDHLTQINASSSSERQQVLDVLRRHGVTHLGGRPIEQAVVTQRGY